MLHICQCCYCKRTLLILKFLLYMKKCYEQFKTEDWVVVAVSILLLAFAIITPNYLPRIPKHLADTESWGNAIFLFVIVLVILYIGWLLLGRPLKGLFLSLIAVFSVLNCSKHFFIYILIKF